MEQLEETFSEYDFWNMFRNLRSLAEKPQKINDVFEIFNMVISYQSLT